MLKLSRREGEGLELYLSPEVDPAAPVGDVFGGHPIRIVVDEMRASQVALAIDAPPEILILREELCDRKPSG